MFQVPVPNFTQTPNILFDEWLPKLGMAELKVLMVIMRKTFGWHKVKDRISLSQLQKITGLERKHVSNGIKGLVAKKLITKVVIGRPGFQETYYELIVIEDSNNFTQCLKDTTPSVLKTPTKETTTKEKKNPQPPKSNKDGGGFSKVILRRSLPMLTEEEFSIAWAEYQKAPPNSVKNPKNWLKAVIERIRFENKNAMDAHERAEAHKRQSEYYESINTDHSLVACSKHVEFIRGSKVKIVEYDMTDEEWTKLTGWIPYGV